MILGTAGRARMISYGDLAAKHFRLDIQCEGTEIKD
jgi:hypothetical protein